MSGPSGLKLTLAKLVASFLLSGSYTDAKNFVKNYSVCQQNKYLPQKKPGLLQPFSIPKRVWEELTKDFVTRPPSFGHTMVWFVCDRLNKSVHLIGLPSKFASPDLASCFSIKIWHLHGIPKTITFDWDSIFLSFFWQKLSKRYFDPYEVFHRYIWATSSIELMHSSYGSHLPSALLSCTISSSPTFIRELTLT